MALSFSAPETHFRIVHAETSIGNDGLRKGEPAAIECCACGASLPLTRERSPGLDELPHSPDCPQRHVRSHWWVDELLADD